MIQYCMLEFIPDNIAMLQCLNQRHFLLDVFVFAFGLLHVSDVQLYHLDRYQLSSVRQTAPHLQVTAVAGQ